MGGVSSSPSSNVRGYVTAESCRGIAGSSTDILLPCKSLASNLSPYEQHYLQITAQRFGLDPRFLTAKIYTESNFDKDAKPTQVPGKVSDGTARGIGQITDATKTTIMETMFEIERPEFKDKSPSGEAYKSAFVEFTNKYDDGARCFKRDSVLSSVDMIAVLLSIRREELADWMSKNNLFPAEQTFEGTPLDHFMCLELDDQNKLLALAYNRGIKGVDRFIKKQAEDSGHADVSCCTYTDLLDWSEDDAYVGNVVDNMDLFLYVDQPSTYEMRSTAYEDTWSGMKNGSDNRDEALRIDQARITVVTTQPSPITTPIQESTATKIYNWFTE